VNTCPADHGYEATARVVVVNNGQETLVGAKFCPLCGTTLERECSTNHCDAYGNKWTGATMWGKPFAHCPDCGQSLKGAGE